MRRVVSKQAGVFLLLSVVLSGCNNSNRDIGGRNHGTVLPAFRAIMDLRERDDYRGAEGRRPQRGTFELEMDVAGSDGEYRASGTKVGDYRIVEGAVAVRWGGVVRERFHFTGILGVAYHRLEIQDMSGVPAVDDETMRPGIRFGGEFRARLAPQFGLHARVTADVTPFDTASTQTEGGFYYTPVDEIGLIFGYKSWRYEDHDSELSGVDDVDLRFDGPYVGMEFRF